MGSLIRMGALIGIGALINKNTFEGGRLFGRGAYWKEGAKSNHYGISMECPIVQDVFIYKLRRSSYYQKHYCEIFKVQNRT